MFCGSTTCLEFKIPIIAFTYSFYVEDYLRRHTPPSDSAKLKNNENSFFGRNSISRFFKLCSYVLGTKVETLHKLQSSISSFVAMVAQNQVDEQQKLKMLRLPQFLSHSVQTSQYCSRYISPQIRVWILRYSDSKYF